MFGWDKNFSKNFLFLRSGTEIKKKLRDKKTSPNLKTNQEINQMSAGEEIKKTTTYDIIIVADISVFLLRYIITLQKKD